ncbi:MAG: glycosyltransferase family 2 protein [Spirochaetales bacterium]|nr:glycosyltransferase family 2 protein [Spirochaetales bacterium]
MLSVIIPVYNGGAGLKALWTRLEPVMKALGCPWEVVFVDDGSTDGSIEQIKGICTTEPSSAWVRLAENRGQQAAVLCGFRHCSGDWAVTIDDDLQHPPEFIPALYSEAEEGRFDAVYAVPGNGSGKAGGLIRDGFFSILLGKPAGMKIGSFRILSRAAVDLICAADGRFVYISAELFSGALRIGSIRYPAEPQAALPAQPSRYGTSGRLILYLKLFLWYTPVIRRLTRLLTEGPGIVSGCRQYRVADKGGFK